MWLHEEAGLRSRGRSDSERNNEERSHQPGGGKGDAHSADVDTPNNRPCPFGLPD